jgi:predicted DNA-binding antitoxin AbrB/MazE fold protein
MTIVDAIYSRGVFTPMGSVALPENQRVRLTVEPSDKPSFETWLADVTEFHRQLIASHGVLPDSTPEIATDRRRDD